MADTTTISEEAPAKPSKKPLMAGIVLAVAGAGAGFYLTSSGLILGTTPTQEEMPALHKDESPAVVFVAMEPLTISLPRNSSSKHLRFRASFEVPKPHQSEVEAIMPRIIDVLNGYLRALEVTDIEDPAALTRLRSQMLRRAQVVAGPERINDLLIMEFVLN